MRIVIIGGGAAGYFAAITAAEADPSIQIDILEAGRAPLRKVRVSGGGRCNVTTGLDQIATIVQNYPRGGRELRRPLRRFGPRQVREWFSRRGVPLKSEADGRVFPVSDDSRSVVDCLKGAVDAAGVCVHVGCAVRGIAIEEQGFRLETAQGEHWADRILLATGGSAAGHVLAERLGHQVVPAVPSLFTFTVRQSWLTTLAGVSVPQARVAVSGLSEPVRSEGPVLITHWGLSGPAVLRASAWGARLLHGRNYMADLEVDWTGAGAEALAVWLRQQRERNPRKQVTNTPPDALPRRLWAALVQQAVVPPSRIWAECTKTEIMHLRRQVCACPILLDGKGVFKEEFVTAGGVAREEIDWRRMASRMQPGLYVAGEVIDVDAMTGGFNFQAAWSTAYVAGLALVAGTTDKAGQSRTTSPC